MKFAEVMTTDELAVYLRVPKPSLYKLVEDGQIPGKKIGRHWRFHKKAVDHWFNSHSNLDGKQTATAFSQAFCGSGEAHDVSEHAEMVGEFDVRLTQLSCGKFNGALNFVRTPDIMIYDERWQRKTMVQGATPQDFVMLGTNAASHRSEIQWCGNVIDQRRFACAGPGAPIDFVMPDLGHDVCMMVNPKVLGGAIGQRAFEALVGSQTIDFAATAGQRLITMIKKSIRESAKCPELLNKPYFVRSLESRLLATLSACLEHSVEADTLSVSRRRTSVRDAISYVENVAGPVTVQDLTVAVGVSQRTLEYAFRDILETTPVSYLRIHRLNAAHRELVSADPGESSVTAIALRWGFGHPGRFSLAHRQLFGEPPSRALSRA